jgi:glycosyltransferase involved in cell wall biosynthesis
MIERNKCRKFVIVTPVYNDWTAFTELLKQFEACGDINGLELHIIAVDDGSSEKLDLGEFQSYCKGPIAELQLIRLACNLGHQRAIAVGLVAAAEIDDLVAVVVMDSDGEDRPSDIAKLILVWTDAPDRAIVAKRGLRTEGMVFRSMYSCYKVAFKLLTGQTIDFGNFCLLPRNVLMALIHNPAIWNNLAAAISRSRIPIAKCQIDRGNRLAGRSRMNFVSLAIHGLSAISVYADVALVRIIAAACAFAFLAFAGLVGVVVIKFMTTWAIPGWASYLAASLIIIFFQAILLGGLAMFQLLSFRSVKPFIPAQDANAFVVVSSRERFRRNDCLDKAS